MKTSLQQLIEDLKEAGFNVGELTIMPKYLELEKKQIIEAANYGLEHFGDIAEDYYNKTYNL